ncbi:exonuclease SbcCD subunit D [candidate division KSB1 bacterium]|nr:exonuclease SbcCD subunit D [candidate division KSB1 bacterium]
MKLIHFSDTHLGYSEYHKIDPATGINQREQDFYDSWNRVIDDIIQLKPDMVLHAGDLFHTTRPGNRAIAIALEGIQKISDCHIPLVIISGNHSTPKIRATGSIFESIDLFPQVYAAYKSEYERFRINACDVHCVPHCSLVDELEQAFNQIKIESDASYNVFMAHGAWTGSRSYSMGEFNEQHLPNPELNLKLQFDYIALGHYHKYLEISDHIIYSGSTERTSYNEVGYSSGYVWVDLAKKTHEYRKIPSRSMVKLPAIDCADLTIKEINDSIEELATPDLEQSLVALELKNIRHDTFLRVDWREIDDMFNHVFHLEKTVTRIGKDNVELSSTTFQSLPVEFERYLDAIELKELDADRLKKLGLDYLQNEDVSE